MAYVSHNNAHVFKDLTTIYDSEKYTSIQLITPFFNSYLDSYI